ncbi:MAG TPA: DUF3597 domain-containing protein [Allosphingosinicella sp.]
MSIFNIIQDRILAHQLAQRQPAQQSAQQPQSGGAGMGGIGGGIGGAAQATQEQPVAASAGFAAVAAAISQPVDVEQVLQDVEREKGGADLNWRTSIVDLMKLLDLDSSLSNRAELARELGYTGETNGSAEMNIWLHRRVMDGLETNGGHVPDSLKG